MRRENRQWDKLPFAVSRSSRATLAAQVADGLRSCIQSGFFKAGDVLPTTRDLAALLGVSRIVTRAAVKSLTDAGLIIPRPHAGCMVLGRGEKLWRGNVLIVTRSDGRGYYDGVFTATLRRRLLAAGWIVTQVSAPHEPGGKTDVSELKLHLGGIVSFAVSIYGNPEAERLLAKAGVPFASFDGEPASVAGGGGECVRYDSAAATAPLARAAAAAGVKSVLFVGCSSHAGDVTDALEAAGMDVAEWRIPLPRAGKMPSVVSFAARDAFLERFSTTKGAKGGAARLPDMIYFSDDYACAGALAALSALGVKVPEDVRVATLANRGCEPVYEKDLCRLEMDPEGDALTFADALVARLEGRDAAFPATFGPTFRKGATL